MHKTPGKKNTDGKATCLPTRVCLHFWLLGILTQRWTSLSGNLPLPDARCHQANQSHTQQADRSRLGDGGAAPS